MKFLCVSLILLQLTLCGAERVFVTGTLMCGDKPYKGALVKLIEKDPIKDDEMGKMTTGVDGKFSLDGTSSEIGNIEPVLKIYHDCDDTVLGKEVPCQRRWAIDLPKTAIQPEGTKVAKEFKMGTMNLEIRQKGEDHDCIH